MLQSVNIPDLNTTIAMLLENPKISQVDTLYNPDLGLYTCVRWSDKNGKEYDLVQDAIDTHLLLNPLNLTSSNGYPYLLLKFPEGDRLFHRLVMGAVGQDIVHHVSEDTLLNCRSMLQVLPRDVHSRHHRLLNIERKRVSK